MTATARRAGPVLPTARGPLSHGVVHALRTARAPDPALWRRTADAEPYGDDLHLSLYVLYELHYRGFAGVGGDREWDPALLTLRRALEDRFLTALRLDVPGPRTPAEVFAELLTEPADPSGSVSHHLRRRGDLDHFRQYAALRSLYHLKEADPHAWVLPRLHGQAKAAMAAIEYDEFGAGRADQVHARLFADLMADLGLDTSYGRYLDLAPAQMLAVVDLMSLLGLHRDLRGALVGHFAWVEVTSSPASRHLAAGLRRVGAGRAAQHFYDEHVEADAVHEQVVRHQVVDGLLADEPALSADVAFGADATTFLEDRLSSHLLAAWRDGRSALRC
ncbi:iron-containing redox enzyme family protein [Streptomyces cocklensis]|uniref:Iron-containing redox enzyme n=1 Tax=Actinacidiphila cocklensis TaxID=887465 RepID=A0A9W4GU18_9ACTN|nr:iron-containing redox enzyme family protein [Actinacidiphila cocklensis]MDD1062122.1 iron-containing redox enzyme family protein [Actinacidiphila cocklensis]WSX74530.1 iron-containing redox enzyme family protein [Streptomyces sp. NBC_00899]CAG6396370.1 Iron-containing redox enzyme [Actinacidiphila cocklensis]